MITLENDQLKIKIKKFGAELCSVIDKKSGFEFIWQGDEAYWKRHAPVLFPIVGRLKDNQYEYKGKTYHMTQHGFARDSDFEVEEVIANAATFSLTFNEETLEIYPFEFKLYVKYLLHGSNVTTTYEVVNLSQTDEMYYAIGGHPAFNVSQKVGEDGELEMDDVYVEMIPHKSYKHIPHTEDGLVHLGQPKPIRGLRRSYTHEDFEIDSLVYEMSNQSEIILQDGTENVEIRIKPSRMSYFGIWSSYPNRAPFLSISPWAGIADNVHGSGKFNEKDSINFLHANEKMTHEFTTRYLKETRMHSIRRWSGRNLV